jgi:phenylpropionate dioxygenase-like ring-hydroxylating dioxygenase large terminal subunit
MNYLRNTWYAAAWSDEIGRTPLARTLLDRPILFYRTEAGRVAAIGNRCPHRFAPLSKGKLFGDAIECPYHGLRFDASGACIHNPHGGGKIPAAAHVPAYAVAECHGLVWLWGGEAAKADPGRIAELGHLQDAALGTVRGYVRMHAHYQLGIDNLIDLSHTQFVHSDTLASKSYGEAHPEVTQEKQTVSVRLSIPNSDVPPAYRRHVDDPNAPVDYWLDATWTAPAMVVNDVGITAPGMPRGQGFRSFGVHILTPETQRTAHYFYAHSRNRKIHDPAVDEQIRQWHKVGFGEQDKPIIEASAAMMGDEVDPLQLGAVLLPTDAGALRARRVLAALIAAEQATAA